MIIGITLALLIKFSGCSSMLSYGAEIFEITGSMMSSNMSIIVVGVVKVIGTCVTISIVDRVGRKVSDC